MRWGKVGQSGEFFRWVGKSGDSILKELEVSDTSCQIN